MASFSEARAPGEPRGRREDLQDQVRAVPHRRQGRLGHKQGEHQS
jgi:hypothetical protein